MTWRHGFIIMVALAVDLACGMVTACAGNAKSIDTLCTMVIGGVLGNMQAGVAGKHLKPKKLPDA